MEVKMFTHPSALEAEAAINEWLQDNPVQVEYIGQSQCEHGGRFVFTLSVFFHRPATSILPACKQARAFS